MAGTRLHVVVSFVLFALAAAPFAWRFTQIERVELPEARIRRLSWRDSRFAQPERFPVAIFALDSADAPVAPLTSADERIQYAPVERVQLTAAQRLALQNAASLQHVDDLLAQIVRETEAAALPDAASSRPFSILLLCDASAKSTQGRVDALVVGKYRHAWSSQCSLSPTSELFAAVDALLTRHVFPLEPAAATRSTKRARTAVKYRLHFALLKSSPRVAWRWDFAETLYPTYLARFVAKVGVLANFTVESEVLQYARLAKDVHASDDGTSYFIRADDLKQFKSANDFLTSSVLDDREQVMHFLATLPELEHAPLGIQARDGTSSRLASSFEIPGWGTVAILDTTRLVESDSKNPDAAKLETKKLMGVFLAQLRTLLGAPSFFERQRAHANEKLTFLPSSRDGIADWELDVLVRARLQHHLKASIATLQSIVQLVDEMPQMSVLERVQQRIVVAVDLLEAILCPREDASTSASTSSQCAASDTPPTDLSALLRKVREAADHADAAYYDHTMIRQLYFPQEQMFGVYAPLLAPLILPFFVGLVREFKRWKTKRAAAHKLHAA